HCPELASFPTRRSSDLLRLVLGALGAGFGLVVLVLVAGLVVACFLVLFGVLVGLILFRFVRVLTQLVAIAQVGDELAGKTRKGGDRKSTRLNSSHVKIS